MCISIVFLQTSRRTANKSQCSAVDTSIEIASVISLSEGLRARCKFVYQNFPPAIDTLGNIMDTSESGRVDDTSASEGVLDISLQVIMCQVKVQRVMIDHTKVSLGNLAAGAVDVPNRIVNFPTRQRLLLDYNLHRGRQTEDTVLFAPEGVSSKVQRTSYLIATVELSRVGESVEPALSALAAIFSALSAYFTISDKK